MKKLVLAAFLLGMVLHASGCTRKSSETSTAPAPTPDTATQSTVAVQDPVVAGQFYPADPNELSKMIAGFLALAKPEVPSGHALGYIVPHAGYVFSGPVAAFTYQAIKQSGAKHFVILAPSHYYYLDGISVLDKDSYRTPLGQVKIDRARVKKLIGYRPWITYDPTLYQKEHSLEVQLPFLQAAVGPDLEIVPIVIGTPLLDQAQRLAGVLNELFGSDQDLVYIASSDMSHYYTYDEAEVMDHLSLSRVLALDEQRLEDDMKNKRAQFCGAGPVFTLMELFKLRGGDPKNIKVLDYRNSGDTSGDKSRVVGYSSVALVLTGAEKPVAVPSPAPAPAPAPTPPAQPEKGAKLMPPEHYSLTTAEKKELMAMARQVVEAVVKTGAMPEVKVNSAKLKEPGAAFVTLTKHGQLRGCIGHIIAQEPLYLCVRDVAKSAALEDPRFQPVSPQELPELEYEISILTAPEPVTDLTTVKVGRDGLIMEDGFHRGVLLPQVPVEYSWSRDEFLSETCHKAGMAPDCWQRGGVKVNRFQALVFDEAELK